MALDASILGAFKPIFTFLLVFVIVYGSLEFSKVFKSNKNLNGLLALVAGFITLFSNVASTVVEIMTPWFLVFVIFLFFALFAVRIFGVDDKKITDTFNDSAVLHVTLIIVAILILVGAIASAFGQSLLEQTTGTGDLPPPSAVPGPDGSPSLDAVASGAATVSAGGTATSSFGGNLLATLIHPKVLGMIFILLIGVFTLIFLTKSST